ncbi:hypothetical protein U3653_26245 [Nocardia sp. CDC186]|uniref:Uncharacterized protein n=1 Tax=Nocardia implantans TaxID=3108168 RepID=A0ABU6B1C4_9NOCA|nr:MULTISPECIES: hypothetical protein [unclassified Nocardia]MBF6195667.1 hypothetical protein [Nocardia beijingensis]MEA3531247.1 hypothetical protein [Nocardia sp. CDC192]MEB3513543.1 hypothetical protein [Nocardia sp. CDC186]
MSDHTTGHRYDDNVIDLAARRRCHLERSGLESAAIAAHLLVETGIVPLWDNSDDDHDFDGGDWAA